MEADPSQTMGEIAEQLDVSHLDVVEVFFFKGSRWKDIDWWKIVTIESWFFNENQH